MRRRHITAVVLFFLTSVLSVGAQTSKQKALEQQRQQLLEEIRVINELLFATKDEKSSLLVTVQSLDQKISVRQNLIRITNEQANLLTREINGNLSSISQLKDELAALKEDYAAMILKSYKSKSQQSRLMFLLSSENFLQAYKRLQYMQQYSRFRRKQGLEIEERTLALNRLNQLLIDQKKDKERLVIQSRQEKTQLGQEKAAVHKLRRQRCR